MKHQEIVQLVDSLKVVSLTRDNFECFAQNARGLFVPKGARFQEYFSPGYNSFTKDKHDWSKGEPEWRAGYRQLVFDRMEQKEIPKGDKIWINVYFDEDIGVWGARPGRKLQKFAFDSNKALYIAEQQGNGTPDHPWETLYVKLE